MTDRQRNWFILLLVAGLLAGSAVVISQFKTFLGLDLRGGVELIYQAEPSPQTPRVTPDAVQRAVDVMSSRVNQLGVAQPSINVSGGNQIDVQLPAVHDVARAEKLVGTTAQLLLYDWEANALLPNGKNTVADKLLVQDPTALAISKGTGLPGAGSMPLYTAVKLASQQPSQPSSSSQSRVGPQYYLFGTPGSTACAAAAKFYGVVNQLGQRCLLAGPDTSTSDLFAALPIRQIRSRPTALPRSSMCSRTTSRCSATTSRTRSRAPTRRATPTWRSASHPPARRSSRTSPPRSLSVETA
jgi:hypothetical protein